MRQPNLDRAKALLFFAVIVAGCGGGSGHRPPTIVAGNVRSASAGTARHGVGRIWQFVRFWTVSQAVAQVPGITVAIQGSSNATATDTNGFFRLTGNQFGPAVLQFTGNGADATLPVTLPSGGELDLVNVDVAGARITVAEQRIQFDGPITGIDCQGKLLQVLSGEQVPFRVRLRPSTAIVDENGAAVSCVDLVTGRTGNVEGTIDPNGDVIARQISLNPAPNTTAQTLNGTIAALDCPIDVIVTPSQGANVQVNIGGSTQISDVGGESLTCSELAVGDGVQVEGTQTTFGINASTLERVSPAPTPTPSPTPTPG